jgi:DNA-directed RNA polymerase subunit RPC12/RpoP
MPIVPCPSCGHEANVREDQIGRRLRCPACQKRFVVERDDEPPLARPVWVEFDCPHCGAGLEVGSASAGKRLPCPGCGRRVQVPLPEEPMIHMPCPFCDIEIIAREAWAGRRMRCAKCQRLVAVPFRRPRDPGVTHCFGCGKKLHHKLLCPLCGECFCSEVCTRRHDEQHLFDPSHDWSTFD